MGDYTRVVSAFCYCYTLIAMKSTQTDNSGFCLVCEVFGAQQIVTHCSDEINKQISNKKSIEYYLDSVLEYVSVAQSFRSMWSQTVHIQSAVHFIHTHARAHRQLKWIGHEYKNADKWENPYHCERVIYHHNYDNITNTYSYV